jgi:hypothetical protein
VGRTQSFGVLEQEPVTFKRLMAINIIAKRAAVNTIMILKVSAKVEF